MDCENIYCVYQANGECILDHISIDNLGGCTECIKISLSNAELEVVKRRSLERLTDQK